MVQPIHTGIAQTQPQPHSLRLVMINTPLIQPPQSQPYVPPNLPSPYPRNTTLQPQNFPTQSLNGRFYQPTMSWNQDSPMGVMPHYLPYPQATQFPPPYYTQNAYIPPPPYHQTTYIPTLSHYQYNTNTQNHPQTQNNHTVPLPNISYTKYTKVEFPKFNGDDLRTRLYKVDPFFADEDITIQQKMKLVLLHFEEDALQWHLGYMRSRGPMPLPTWDEYLWALCDGFGAEYSDPMTELMNIKHTCSVKDYQKAFVSVMTRINLSTEYDINIFLNNLKPELSNVVKLEWSAAAATTPQSTSPSFFPSRYSFGPYECKKCIFEAI
uniref:Uncharacterized protein LOC104227259 isoform X1 n=1 Tax=Nicotiana sylvestris TaxID=4096 RepID=A0A1U7WKE9_NICSY|nr:PREDICTED: uncharacterized protein LOC104227259 isoform X1 [Nicotiana sylvestris]